MGQLCAEKLPQAIDTAGNLVGRQQVGPLGRGIQIDSVRDPISGIYLLPGLESLFPVGRDGYAALPLKDNCVYMLWGG